MKKKLVPVLVVLALIAVGAGGYFMGQRSNAPTADNPPAQSSTPTTPAAETTSPEPSAEPIADTAPQDGFTASIYTVYVKPQYAEDDGVPVYDRSEWTLDTTELWRTSGGYGAPYVCTGIGYGQYEGWIEIIDPQGNTGYTQDIWFTTELEVTNHQQAEVEKQEPAQVEQQTPAKTQKPAEQNTPGNNGNRKIEIDYSQIPGYNNERQPVIPEDKQIKNGGEGYESSSDVSINYSGKISG